MAHLLPAARGESLLLAHRAALTLFLALLVVPSAALAQSATVTVSPQGATGTAGPERLTIVATRRA